MTLPTETPPPVLQFKGPRNAEWRLLEAKDGANANTKTAERNMEDLREILLNSLQMQHLVVLAGSGCSISAGGPSMDDLWAAVVGTPPSATAGQVAEAVGHPIDIHNVEALLSRVEALEQLKSNSVLSEFLRSSKKTILDRCSSFLNDERLDGHRMFLHRLSRRRARDERLKVFTSNYDLCFERAAGLVGGVVLDGFSFGGLRRYDPRFFSYDIVRRSRNGDDAASYLEGVFLLHKLHGSVNWARKPDGTIHEEANPKPEEVCLIYPAAGKYQQSFTQPYLESMAQYLAALREPNTCVLVAGFGFNDDHLSEPLVAAVTSNPHLRTIVIDAAAYEHVSGKNRHWARLAQQNAHGDDVWFVAAEFARFAQMVPDLKALSPAESLKRAIQSVVQSQ